MRANVRARSRLHRRSRHWMHGCGCCRAPPRYFLSHSGNNWRTGDEHLRRAAHQQRVVTLRDLRRAEACHGTKTETYDRHRREIPDHVIPPRQVRDVRVAHCFERLHGAAAAAAFDEPHDRHAQLVRHLLGRDLFLDDRRIRRAATHREVVAGDDDAPAFDRAAAEHEVRGHQARDRAILVVRRDAGDRAELAEAVGVEQRLDALAHGEATRGALACDFLVAAHLLRERLALSQLFEFAFPAHGEECSSVDIGRALRLVTCDMRLTGRPQL